MKLTIKTKLFLVFGFLIATMITLGVYATYDLKVVNNKSAELANNWLAGVDVAHSINEAIYNYRITEYKRVVSTNQNEIIQLDKELEASNQEIEKHLSNYEKTLYDENDKKLWSALKTNWGKYIQDNKKFFALSKNLKTEEAVQLMQGESLQSFNAASKSALDLVKFNQEHGTVSSKEVDDLYNSAKWILTVCIVLATLLGIGAAYFISRYITTSINELLRISQLVAKGDLQENITVKSQDELGQLAIAFNEMIANLKQLIAKISGTSEQVAASSEELTASAEQSAQAANHIAATITEVAYGSENQVSAVNEASAAVEQMSAGIKHVADSANTVAGMSANTTTAAQSGGKAVATAVRQMEHIEDTVINSAQVVTKLGDRSKEIGQIVDTISGIAGQTNLLALNAAIEAARAGEHGRGFAVVADEVRKLAEQSQDAAKRIATLIGEIQGDTEKAVAAMEQGTKEVKIGAEVVTTAGQAFKEITDHINNVSDQVKEISAAIQQLASGSQQIVGSVQEIEKISKTTAGQSQTVSAATEEQSASVQEIASASQSLASMAQELQDAVNKFRL